MHLDQGFDLAHEQLFFQSQLHMLCKASCQPFDQSSMVFVAECIPGNEVYKSSFVQFR